MLLHDSLWTVIIVIPPLNHYYLHENRSIVLKGEGLNQSVHQLVNMFPSSPLVSHPVFVLSVTLSSLRECGESEETATFSCWASLPAFFCILWATLMSSGMRVFRAPFTQDWFQQVYIQQYVYCTTVCYNMQILYYRKICWTKVASHISDFYSLNFNQTDVSVSNKIHDLKMPSSKGIFCWKKVKKKKVLVSCNDDKNLKILSTKLFKLVMKEVLVETNIMNDHAGVRCSGFCGNWAVQHHYDSCNASLMDPSKTDWNICSTCVRANGSAS